MEGDEGDRHDDPRRITELIHWTTLALRLPTARIDTVFQTEDSCRDRLSAVRWPNGVTCTMCGSQEVSDLSGRSFFRCRPCRTQFSVTSGTALHRTHVPLQVWFVATDTVIRAHARTACAYHIPGRKLAQELRRPYRGAVRLKEIIVADAGVSGPGLLRESICVDDFSLPTDIDPNTPTHAWWLQNRWRHKRLGRGE
jgi:transposase-like protein